MNLSGNKKKGRPPIFGPLLPGKKRYFHRPSSKPCSVSGCDNTFRCNYKGSAYCEKHYAKITRTGTLDRIAGTEAYLARLREKRLEKLSDVSRIDRTPDRRKGQRGYLANKIVAQVRNDAKGHGREWYLTNLEAYRLITGDCVYCGAPSGWPETRNGIDRVDTKLEYTLDNCVSCCFPCNSAKSDGTVEEFKRWFVNACKSENTILAQALLDAALKFAA